MKATMLGISLETVAVLCCTACSEAQQKESAETPTPLPETTEIAVFGGGCFWCTEAIYERVDGVLEATPGYAGGETPNPTYENVCKGTTGHAEVVRIVYTPERVSFEQLLDVFFATHDPTTLNRQGADVGTQYRSVIFCQDETQRKAAEAKKQSLDAAEAFAAPIVTTIEQAAPFYEAEDYHKDYFNRNSTQPYCRAVIAPKIRKFEQKQERIPGR